MYELIVNSSYDLPEALSGRVFSYYVVGEVSVDPVNSGVYVRWYTTSGTLGKCMSSRWRLIIALLAMIVGVYSLFPTSDSLTSLCGWNLK